MKIFFGVILLFSFSLHAMKNNKNDESPHAGDVITPEYINTLNRNNLADFASRNIKQMTEIGSNENVNAVVHLDIKLSNGTRTTCRYCIMEQNKVIHILTNKREKLIKEGVKFPEFMPISVLREMPTDPKKAQEYLDKYLDKK